MSERSLLSGSVRVFGGSDGKERIFQILPDGKVETGGSVICYEAQYGSSRRGTLKELYPLGNSAFIRSPDHLVIPIPKNHCAAEEFDSLYVSDAVLVPEFAPEEKMFGTYYRCESVKYNTPNENRLFRVLKADSGKGSVGEGEGCRYKNLFATWCLGPVLVRNPLMMKEVLHCVLGEDYRETDFSLEEKAVKMTIEELL